MSDNNIKELINAAIKARKNAYTPYSDFKVGAALLTADGDIIRGCNVENAAYSPSICAERTAISAAIACGHKNFTAIAVVGGKDELADNCYPCGVCRQTLTEFCPPDFPIIIAQSPENYKIMTLSELLPHSFSSENL